MTAPTEDDSGPKIPEKLGSIELPPTGTGVRAARRAARAAAESTGAASTTLDELREPSPAVEDEPAPEPEAVRRRPSRSFTIMFTSGLVVCTLIAGALAVLGIQTLRDSTAGRTVVSAEPDEPGFEGFLEPTPTLVLFDERGGFLQSVTLLSLNSGDTGGSVVLIPARTEVGRSGTLDFSFAYAAPLEQMRESVEVVTAVGISEAITLDADKWEALVAPVAPLEIDNPDAIEGFDAGPIQLAASDVGRWLGEVADEEDELARLVRHELLWEAWIKAVAEADDASAVPGELDSGVGRFVRGLARGPFTVSTLPVTAVVNESGGTTYEVDRAATRSLMTAAVPFPLGTRAAPRLHVRLLDGTGDPNHVSLVAPSVVRANSSIVVVGNADHFEYTETEIRYHQPEHRRAAEQIREELGAGRVIEDVRPIDSFGVTIVLGTDV